MYQAQFRITCDTDRCGAAWPETGWAPSRIVAWREARAAGWRHDYEQHRCPRHAAETELADRVRVLVAADLTDGQIGAQVGMTRGGVQAVRVRHGIPGRRTGRPRGAR